MLSALPAPWGNTPAFGRAGRCPDQANYSLEIALYPSGRGNRARRPLGQVTLPRFREGVGERRGEPQLDVSQADQLPPVLFVPYLGGLKLVEQQTVLREAKEMLQVETLTIGGVDLFERQLGASSPPYDQPQRALEHKRSGLGIEDAASEQIEGLRVHGATAMASHQQVVPALNLDAQAASFLGPIRQLGDLRRCAPGLGIGESERLTIPGRVTATGRGARGIGWLAIVDPVVCAARDDHMIGEVAGRVQVGGTVVVGVDDFGAQRLAVGKRRVVQQGADLLGGDVGGLRLGGHALAIQGNDPRRIEGGNAPAGLPQPNRCAR